MDDHTQYKDMYFKLYNAVTDAIRILVRAQLDCEDMYARQGEGEPVPEDALLMETEFIQGIVRQLTEEQNDPSMP